MVANVALNNDEVIVNCRLGYIALQKEVLEFGGGAGHWKLKSRKVSVESDETTTLQLAMC